MKGRHALAAIALLACTSAPAAVLYKSVSTTGVVEFSDLPPEQGRKLEQIRIPDPASVAAATPIASGPSREEELRDAAVARASAKLDVAEHALAQARRSIEEDADSMHMVSMRLSRADHDRLAFYKKDVLLARQELLEVLKEKRKADAAAPTLTASNEGMALN